MKLSITKVKFHVDSKLVVADPCYVDEDNEGFSTINRQYTDSEFTLGLVLDECRGEWVGEIEVSDQGEWGNRVSVLRLARVGSRLEIPSVPAIVGMNAVDSGQMFAGCASVLPLDYEALLRAYQTGDPDESPYGSGEAGWENHLCLDFGGGVVSSTGFGDGLYPVYLYADAAGRPALVEVRFLEDESEDE